MSARGRYVAACTLLPIWISGFDEGSGKYTYTFSKRKAKRYDKPEYARMDIEALGPVWAANMEVRECRGR